MKLGRGIRRGKPEVMIAPLIDVVFLLLIFYAVTTQFVNDQRLKLKLPEAKTAQKVGQGAETKPPVISVAADGGVWIDGKQVPEGRLEEAVKQAVKGSKDGSVVIKGDRDADYGVVIKVLDTARASGAKMIQMSAIKPEGGGAHSP